MNKKIAIDLTTFSEKFNGGKDQVAYNLLQYIENSKECSDDYVVFCSEKLSQQLGDSGINLQCIIAPEITNDCSILRRALHMVELWMLETRESIKRKIGLLVFTNKATCQLPFMIPTLIIPHDIQSLIRLETGTALSRICLRLELLVRSKIICISEYDMEQVRTKLKFLSKKTTMIYDPIVFRPYVENPYGNRYITAVNFSHPHKNAATVVEAFIKIAEETDFKFLIVGNYPYDMIGASKAARVECA